MFAAAHKRHSPFHVERVLVQALADLVGEQVQPVPDAAGRIAGVNGRPAPAADAVIGRRPQRHDFGRVDGDPLQKIIKGHIVPFQILDAFKRCGGVIELKAVFSFEVLGKNVIRVFNDQMSQELSWGLFAWPRQTLGSFRNAAYFACHVDFIEKVFR